MDYQITTAPAHEPVSLEQAKRHLRVDDGDSDALIRSYLQSARIWCEEYAGRAFLWQTFTGRLDVFPVLMQMPRPPLLSISSITYVDTAGVTQTVASTIYDVDTQSEPGKVLLAYDQEWPSDLRGHHHDVTVTFIAGHAKVCTRSGDTLLVPGHRHEIGDPVQVYNIGGALPAGLSAGVTYYVASVSGTAVTLAATEGGAAITLADAGTGVHTIDALPSLYANAILLRLTRMWMHRGDEEAPEGRAERELLGMRRMVPL